MNDTLSLIPLGGVGDVTRNMYIYEFRDEILLVDCGLGFADETMLGVDLLLPDISYLLQTQKRIVGMVLTHGHEDHIGALPFVLPQLPNFPIFATPLTAALANTKLKEFKTSRSVGTIHFDKPNLKIGSFDITFIRVTHSVPDTSNIFIKTPIGNFYHGSDFKFDLTPADGKRADFHSIAQAGKEGVLCLLSDSLGSEREGFTRSEHAVELSFEEAFRNCRGKAIITTYSSNISRLNQAIAVAKRLNRKVCFVGRSLIKAKEVAQRLGYMKALRDMEVPLERLKRFKDNQVLLLVAGSQGQETSAMTRIANGEHDFIELASDDVVIFSSDPIPGNEISVNSLVDTIAKKGAQVLYSDISNEFHVSGHGSGQDILLLMSLTKPQFLLPIGGTYKHMVAFRKLAYKLGFTNRNLLLIENGQELVFSRNSVHPGRKLNVKKVYVDEITGEELEGYVLRDRQKLSESGVIIVLTEIDSETGQIVGTPDIIARGFTIDNKQLADKLFAELAKNIKNKGPVTNWVHMRRSIGEISERFIYRQYRSHPLVLPVVIEV